ncbi:MAG: class I SAM-dependent methyltransferase [Hyphomicrobiales bacterium]
MENNDQSKKLEVMALNTLRGVRKEGFFIPYRYAGDVPEHSPEYKGLSSRFAQAHETFQTWIDHANDFAQELGGIDGTSAFQARFDQYWFPRLDAAIAYTMVRTLKPKRIVEVGSGHSTRFMALAIDHEMYDASFTAIDPEPRKEVANLPINFERTTLQHVDLSLFETLHEGDFLCFDSSHILMPGTDVDIAINRILPLLPKGVVVFFHDIFLPYAYPDDWLWRGYNEQNAVGGLLQGGYELLFASHYVLKRMEQSVVNSAIGQLPLLKGAHECGLWMRKG